MALPSSAPALEPVEQPVSAAAVPVAAAEHRYPVEFTATAGEYFRIWIVNLALTIVTLSIYSAWAKVRKRRYFYGHTRIAGEGLEYRAPPIAILKGRLIATALLAVFFVGGRFIPGLDLEGLTGKAVFSVVGVFVGPWLLVRSFKFNAYHTAYRNVRLRFIGTYKTCVAVVIRYVWYLLLGFGYPVFRHRLVEYVAQNHAYGTTQFEVLDFKKPFTRPYWVAYATGLAFAFAAGVALPMTAGTAGEKPPAPPFLFVFLLYLAFIPLFAYVRARTTNAVWNNTRVGPARFECTLRGRDFVWLYFTNALAVVFTLGFATPWAVIRMLRYRARKFSVVAAGPLDGFVPAEGESVGAAGEEMAALFDFDIAL